MSKVLFVGLACFDIVCVNEGWPEEDTDSQVLSQCLRRGGNASNSATCFVSLIRWQKNKGQQCDYEVEFFGTLAGDSGAE